MLENILRENVENYMSHSNKLWKKSLVENLSKSKKGYGFVTGGEGIRLEVSSSPVDIRFFSYYDIVGAPLCVGTCNPYQLTNASSLIYHFL